MLNADERSLKLSNLAELEKAKHLSHKKLYRKLETSDFSLELTPLALEATEAKSLEPEEILPVFFTEEACEWLMKLPNLYWFWKVLDKAYEWQLDSGLERIDAATVLRAMGDLRESAPRSMVSCNLPPESLSPEQLATRTAYAVFLTGPDEQIVRNIVFSLDYTPQY